VTPHPEDARAAEVEDAPLDFLAPAEKPGELGRLGPYRVVKVLGAGGMGMVLQAEDPLLKRTVALKVMRPELAAKETSRQRFLREAQATAAVEHPYIVPIHQVGEDRHVPFIAMPFLKGQTLDARLRREKKLAVAEAVRIARQTAEGLAAAHKNGLIHRDIKPANLWLEAETGWVKILDFGLARATSDDVDLTKLTASGTIVGTPAFMAPEQAMGKPVDGRCDLFSLGAVLYRMLAGRLPFQGSDTMSILMALANDTPKPLQELNADVPAPLADLVMQLLAKDPAQRPASAAAVAEALAHWEQEKTQVGARGAVSVQRGVSVQTQTHSPRRLRYVVGGAVGLLLVMVVFLFRPGKPKPQQTEHVQALPEPAKSLPATFSNNLGMEFVLVPKGKFWMGGHDGKLGDKEVNISHDFYLGKYTVTQEEWEKVMGKNPSYFSRTGAKDAVKDISDADLRRFPVESVTWEDSQVFIAKLNQQVKETGWRYRLPTEAEWEYACRGGPSANESDYTFNYYLDKPTDRLLPDQANVPGYGVGTTCKVGCYTPNRLGLYDMHGNVLQWCEDEAPNLKDPKAAPWRVTRGCGWYQGPAKTAARFPLPRVFPSNYVGLRLARVPVPPDKDLTAFTNSLGMEFVLVPKGKFWMGGGGGKLGDKQVEIAHDFYLGKYTVTQEEWEKVTGRTPSFFSRTGAGKEAVKDISDADLKRFPVESVSWNDAQTFLALLNRRDKQVGWTYRLPTEAEWEYACRGGPSGTEADFAFNYYLDKPSDRLLPDQTNSFGLLKRTCRVGSYRPNRLGLHDMQGNVSQWCADEIPADPKDAKPVARRMVRGGNYNAPHTAAARTPAVPLAAQPTIGLRLARVPAATQ
jgi:formylglycine-generating enzyme required for sulfatase activity/tRNA A-37 threonylcarbamoyl transferase component Bud32